MIDQHEGIDGLRPQGEQALARLRARHADDLRLRAVRRVRQAPTAVDETTRTPAGSAVLPLPPLARSLHTPRG